MPTNAELDSKYKGFMALGAIELIGGAIILIGGGVTRNTPLTWSGGLIGITGAISLIATGVNERKPIENDVTPDYIKSIEELNKVNKAYNDTLTNGCDPNSQRESTRCWGSAVPYKPIYEIPRPNDTIDYKYNLSVGVPSGILLPFALITMIGGISRMYEGDAQRTPVRVRAQTPAQQIFRNPLRTVDGNNQMPDYMDYMNYLRNMNPGLNI